ncbi:hypothetical protein BDB01DRAFT_900847 [Pilobolus umbonatus]|nr:hypothetical protein BDB01DRAFT_900847 [Pilobolus umbonatus]
MVRYGLGIQGCLFTLVFTLSGVFSHGNIVQGIFRHGPPGLMARIQFVIVYLLVLLAYLLCLSTLFMTIYSSSYLSLRQQIISRLEILEAQTCFEDFPGYI